MKKNLFSFVCLIFSAFACAALINNHERARIIEVAGSEIYYFSGEKYVLLKKAEYFYGYGMIGKDHIFIAYQPSTEVEAIAYIEIVNLSNDSRKELFRIPGAGDSHFDINPVNGAVVFNDGEGIKIMQINIFNSTYTIKPVITRKATSSISVDYGQGVFWIDEFHIGYFKSINNVNEFVKSKVPNLKELPSL